MSTRFWSAILACIVLSIGTAASAPVDLGIITGSEKGTHSDVLAFVARVETDPVLKRIAKKMRVHILGRKNIADFDELADKRVAIGREGDSVGRFAQLLGSNMGWLMENGHVKWKSVRLDYPLKGWEQYDCVRKNLGRTAAPVSAGSSENPVLNAIKSILGD